MRADQPPRFAEWLVTVVTSHSPFGPSVHGDLRESFEQIAATSPPRARRWYWRSALSLFARFSAERVRRPEVGRDARYAWRSLRRAPAFTVVVAATLALGIGANAAVLGVIDALYFRKLPVPHPEQIVGIYAGDVRDRGRRELRGGGWADPSIFAALGRRLEGVRGVAAYEMAALDAGGPLAGSSTWSAFVSGEYFGLLGVAPERGRFIRPDEDDPSRPQPVVVISDFLWRERFGAAENTVGRVIPVGRGDFTIVGVAPPGFTGLHPEGRTDLWLPSALSAVARGERARPKAEPADAGPRVVFARLASGASVRRVQASADAVARELAEAQPAYRQLALYVRVRDRLTTIELSAGGFVGSVFVLLMIALLHLASCTNIASLMLARASARRRELGIRLCLGASRARILMQSLIESAIVGAFGGAGGLIVARWLSAGLARAQFLSASDAGLDWRVVGIVMAVSLLTVLQFGLVPAFDASRSDPLTIIRGESPTPRRGRRGERAEMVVVIQLVLSMVLIGNAAAFVRMFERQTTGAPGYDVQHVVLLHANGPYDPELPRRAGALPGSVHVAVAVGAPLHDVRWWGDVTVPGFDAPSESPAQTALQLVGPGYFTTIGAALARGREFDAADTTTAGTKAGGVSAGAGVAVVNEALARRLWGSVDVLGRQFQLGGKASTIVGVARDMRDVSTQAPVPRAYFPLRNASNERVDVLVRTSDDADAALARIRPALGNDVDGAPRGLTTLGAVRNGALSLSRTVSISLLIGASIALGLAALGLYGLVAMWAVRRRREIGIRIALGARSRDVFALLLSGAGRLIVAGLGLGIICAFGLIQVERGWLGPALKLDLAASVASMMVLASAAGLAVLLPSQRAVRGVPADALRSA